MNGSGSRWAPVAAVVAAAFVASPAVATARTGSLAQLWSVRTHGAIAARPVLHAGVVYAGSWDGDEYALDERTGRVLWKTWLGVTGAKCPDPSFGGVTSAPAFASGRAYLGGGDAYWYALDTRTGRPLWRVFTGDDSVTGGHYNWSSPALAGRHAFVGVASFCDSPLVQGQLLRVDLDTHAVDAVWNVVPSGAHGGTIWSTPVVDAGGRRLFVTTGNGALGERYAESIVAVDTRSVRPVDSWKLDPRHRVLDSDWGTSPTLFADRRGRRLIAAANKNGILYAFRRDALRRGPVWERRLDAGGSCPPCGEGSVSTGAFDGRRLYYAAGRTTIGRRRRAGSVRALDPATGRVIWQRPLPSTTLGGVVASRGIVVVPAKSGLYVLRARDGAVLDANRFRGDLWATPLVTAGRIVVGTVDGTIHALRLRRP